MTTASITARLRDARRARAEHRALVRELSIYTSPHEVDDVLALISDRDDADAERIRRILTSNGQQFAGHTSLAS